MKIGIVFILSLSLAACSKELDWTICPDGSPCAGECCHKYPLGRTYRCCQGAWRCRSVFKVGFCFLSKFRNEKAERFSAMTKDTFLSPNRAVEHMTTSGETVESNQVDSEAKSAMVDAMKTENFSLSTQTQYSDSTDTQIGNISKDIGENDDYGNQDEKK